MTCDYKTCSTEVPPERKRFCSQKCKNKYHVAKRRRQNKIDLIDHFGGACVECGYDKCAAALQFHHKDNNKSFGVASKGSTVAYAKLLEEASKCDLICANCHAAKHYDG